jgi:hypothetical protein
MNSELKLRSLSLDASRTRHHARDLTGSPKTTDVWLHDTSPDVHCCTSRWDDNHVVDTMAFRWRVLQRHNRQTVCWKGAGTNCLLSKESALAHTYGTRPDRLRAWDPDSLAAIFPLPATAGELPGCEDR